MVAELPVMTRWWSEGETGYLGGGEKCQEKVALGRECFSCKMNKGPKGVRMVMVAVISTESGTYEDRPIREMKILFKCEELC